LESFSDLNSFVVSPRLAKDERKKRLSGFGRNGLEFADAAIASPKR
jgi:hypothetical protein